MAIERLRAVLAPEPMGEGDDTIGLVIYTGAIVDRWDPYTGESYTLALDVSLDAVDTARVDQGTAPLLDSHDGYSTDSVLGVIVAGSVVFEDGAVKARARLSVDEEKAGKIADIRAGILRAVSVGADILESKETGGKGQTRRHVQATRWAIAEASIVAIGADPAAQTFSRQQPQGEGEMGDTVDLSAVRADAARLERERIAGIELTGRVTRASAERIAELRDSGATLEAARAALISEAADRDAATPVRPQVAILRDAGDTTIEQVKAALIAKANPGKAEYQVPEANRFRRNRAVEMLRALLDVRGVAHQSWSDERVARQYLSRSTSDFPDVLGDAIGKVLVQQYQALPREYEAFTARGTFSGLYAREPIILSGLGALEEVAEGAPYRETTLTEGAESYSPKKYGHVIKLTMEAFLKDNLDAFSRLPIMQANAARNKENAIIAALFAANSGYGPTLTVDSTALFNSAHSNLVASGSGGAPTPARVDALAQLIEGQTDAQGEKIGLQWKKIVVPSALYFQTLQYVSDRFQPNSVAEVAGYTAEDVVKFSGLSSAKKWYLFSDPMLTPAIEWAIPDNTDPLTLEVEEEFKNDTRSYKTRLWFGAAAIDFRGAAMNFGE